MDKNSIEEKILKIIEKKEKNNLTQISMYKEQLDELLRNLEKEEDNTSGEKIEKTEKIEKISEKLNFIQNLKVTSEEIVVSDILIISRTVRYQRQSNQ